MPTAFVTGTSTGIGLETALHLARAGYRVFAGVRNPHSAPLLRQAVDAGLTIVPVRLDVTNDDSVREAAACALASGPVDVLVNNAGIGLAGAAELVPLDEVRALFETNFYGAVRMIQTLVPHMRERRSGTIVNITSIMGRVTFGCHGFYAASKFALAAVSEALAVEVQPFNIRVVIIEPGVIVTPIWNKDGYTMPEDHPYQQPMARLWHQFKAQLDGGTTPDVVARAVLDAINTDSPQLHYPVGPDCEATVAARSRVSGQQWIDYQTEPDTEKFITGAETLFGADLYNPPSLYARRRKST